MQTLCLCMIVKNEEKILARCLRAARHSIHSYLICDSGSTDSTKEIIRTELAGLPGEILDHPWESFGANKTKMLAAAKGKADYLLLLDADHQLKVHGRFPELSADQYLIQFDGDLSYRLPQLIRGDLNWHYVGPTHEYLDGEGKVREPLDCITIADHCDGTNRSQKFQRDIQLLEEALKKDPLNPRYVYYLAQSYRDLGQTDQAIPLYQQRASLGGWEEERWHAQYQAAKLADQGYEPLLHAAAQRPERLEPTCRLVEKARAQSNYKLGLHFAKGHLAIKLSPPPKDILFIEREVYDWKLWFEVGLCAYYCDNFSLYRQGMWEAINAITCPNHIKERAKQNLRDFPGVKSPFTPGRLILYRSPV